MPVHNHEDIFRYLSGQLSDSERDRVEAHLKACTECSDLLAFVRDFNSTLKRMHPVELQPHTPCPDPDTITAFASGELEAEASQLVQQHTILCKSCLEEVFLLRRAAEGAGVGITIDSTDSTDWWRANLKPIPAFGAFAKRTIDIIVSAIVLLLFSPLIGLLALGIRIDSPGPVLYRSLRVGKKGCLFTCYQFRSMFESVDDDTDHLSQVCKDLNSDVEISYVRRLTRIGEFFRRFRRGNLPHGWKYGLEDLPQLWNVLKGDMSLVGPPPRAPDELSDQETEYIRRLDVKPGITGLWRVLFPLAPPHKQPLALDVKYVEQWSLRQDAEILLKTIPAVLSGSRKSTSH